jgi:hypothetical protein
MFVHLPEFNGDTVFKVFTRSDIVILGPPERDETISSDFASKRLVLKKHGFVAFNLLKLTIEDFIFPWQTSPL